MWEPVNPPRPQLVIVFPHKTLVLYFRPHPEDVIAQIRGETASAGIAGYEVWTSRGEKIEWPGELYTYLSEERSVPVIIVRPRSPAGEV